MASLREIMRKVLRRSPIDRVDYLAERATLARAIARHAQGGQVRLVVRQMDCDCAEWTSSGLHPANVVHVQRAIDWVYDGAEGRVSWWLTSPADVPERNERDHALEAFEEGHAHVVYA